MTYGADSPHSRSSIGSIFNDIPGQPGAQQAVRPGEVDQGQKAMSLNRVIELLREANLEAVAEGENAATLQLPHSRFTFPVAISLDQDREKVRLELLLTDLNSKSLSPERLMGLLASNLEIQPAFFTFSDKRKRMELVGSVAFGQANAQSLRDELSRLSGIAEGTASLWESTDAAPTSGGTNLAAATGGNVAASPPAPAPRINTNGNLVGKWSASRSQTEAFAMQLNTDGSFVLVFVKDGKQSKSSGKFTLGGNLLTLTTSDGGKFSGEIGNVNARSFEFTPQGGRASKLTFQKAS
jgi:uncharacterized protein (TIGR03066 family)